MSAAVDIAPCVVDLAHLVERALQWTYLDALEWVRGALEAGHRLEDLTRAALACAARGETTELDLFTAVQDVRRADAERAVCAALGDELHFAKQRVAARAVSEYLLGRLRCEDIGAEVTRRMEEVGRG